MCGTEFERRYDTTSTIDHFHEIHTDGAEKNRAPTRIVFVGKTHPRLDLTLSGCGYIRKYPASCPFWTKHCSVEVLPENISMLPPVGIANVVVVTSARASGNEAVVQNLTVTDSTGRDRYDKKPVKVLFVREASWQANASGFDYIMGSFAAVFHPRIIVNPNFLVRPADLLNMKLQPTPQSLQEKLRPSAKRGFALAIISDCKPATRFRLEYLAALQKYLGEENLHIYGKCGSRPAPSKPISNARELIEGYKFYFAMENSIRDGYVTEKLYASLTYGTVLVYLGTRNAPTVTKKPSYVNILDFATPNVSIIYKYIQPPATDSESFASSLS